jgi:hypothetical protein
VKDMKKVAGKKHMLPRDRNDDPAGSDEDGGDGATLGGGGTTLSSNDVAESIGRWWSGLEPKADPSTRSSIDLSRMVSKSIARSTQHHGIASHS